MKLINAILRPGKVLQVLENGCIKASAPGLFSSEDTEKIPPVMPFFNLIGGHANSFSKPKENDNIWLLNLTDNPRQLYWFRKDDEKANEELIGDENVEIICNKDLDGDWATLYFSDGRGWIISNADAFIQINPDGSIKLDTGMPNRCIDINDNNISLGSAGESAHPAAYGDVVTKICNKIQICLELMQLAANTSPYTKAMATAIGNIPNDLKKLNEQISSTNVTLD